MCSSMACWLALCPNSKRLPRAGWEMVLSYAIYGSSVFDLGRVLACRFQKGTRIQIQFTRTFRGLNFA